jgi:C1A family cysteine protease
MGNYNSTQTPRKYGWRKPAKVAEHRMLNLIIPDNTVYPPSIDLRNLFNYVFDQGTLGSCVANASASAMTVVINKSNIQNKDTRSRLFIYFNARVIDGDPHADTGTTVEAAILGLENNGACSETDWPYIISSFTTMPPKLSYTNALPYKPISAHAVQQTLQALKHELANGNVIIFGILVYMSFESADTTKTGIVAMPNLAAQPPDTCLGGHAILLVGYNEDKQVFIFRNSWGEAWGDKGYGYIPYQYVLNPMLAGDFWVIEKLNIPTA